MRYLLKLSYIGTNYRGLQRIIESGLTDLESVQGVLEYSLRRVCKYPVKVITSSRTDAGVHALASTLQVDFKEEWTPDILCPEQLCQALNEGLAVAGTDIRVRNIVEVPHTFHCRRNASSRSYCYRLAVSRNKEFLAQVARSYRWSSALPIEFLHRRELVTEPFDAEQLYDVCSIFLGTWNFRTFMAADSSLTNITDAFYVKTLKRISFSKVNTRVTNHFDPASTRFDFYDFNFEGSGFLRKQVRRMVAALIGVAKGNITTDQILFMLKNPSEKHWPKHLSTVSPHGLFLKSVNYNEIPVTRGVLHSM